MPRRRDEWNYLSGHPPACTCSECNQRRLESLLRGTGTRRRGVWMRLRWALLGIVIGASATVAAAIFIPEFTDQLIELGEQVSSWQSPDSIRETSREQSPSSADDQSITGAAPAPTRVVAKQPLSTPTETLATQPAPSADDQSVTGSAPSPTPVIAREPSRPPTELPKASRSRLKDQLPRDVFEQFEDSFYGTCTKPPFEDLNIAESWSGVESDQIEILPPRGTYYLVLVGAPSEPAWRFDSVLESQRGRRFQSLRIDSSIPDNLTDAQARCQQGSGMLLPDVLRIESLNLAWPVYLIAPVGTDAPSREVLAALSGYYSNCPPCRILLVCRLLSSERGHLLKLLSIEPSRHSTFWG